MKQPSKKEVNQILAELIRCGHVIANPDGTFSLSPEMHRFMQAQINRDPTLYRKLFPDRVH